MMIWNVATGVRTRQYSIPGELEVIAWSSDGTRIASGSVGDDWEEGQTYLLHIWDLQTGASLFTETFRVRLRPGGFFPLSNNGAVSTPWHPHSLRPWLSPR